MRQLRRGRGGSCCGLRATGDVRTRVPIAELNGAPVGSANARRRSWADDRLVDDRAMGPRGGSRTRGAAARVGRGCGRGSKRTPKGRRVQSPTDRGGPRDWGSGGREPGRAPSRVAAWLRRATWAADHEPRYERARARVPRRQARRKAQAGERARQRRREPASAGGAPRRASPRCSCLGGPRVRCLAVCRRRGQARDAAARRGRGSGLAPQALTTTDPPRPRALACSPPPPGWSRSTTRPPPAAALPRRP